MEMFQLIYRWKGGNQVINVYGRYPSKEGALLAFARYVVEDAESYARKGSPDDQVTLIVVAPSGRHLVKAELNAGELAKAFKKGDRR